MLLRRAAVVLLLSVATATRADDFETQLWANYTLGWNRSEKTYLELDFEPKVLLSGGEPWRNIDTSLTVEYYPNEWVDIEGEVTGGTTRQVDDLRTNELTFRAGVRSHFIKNMSGRTRFERNPFGRSSFDTLFRIEQRNFWYSDNTDSQHSARLRARMEFKTPLNGKALSADGNVYLMADAEAYVPVGDEIDERFATKFRARLGLGYRFDSRRRFDVLYILDRTRNTIDETPGKSMEAFDVRYRIVF